MKANQMMNENFVYGTVNDSIVNISKTMEDHKTFTCPILNSDKKLLGWVTSLDITRGLRENKELVSEVMHPFEEIWTIYEGEQARLAVIETTNRKLVSIPVLNKDDQVIGIIKSFDMIKTFSDLYDIKVYKLYEAMLDRLKGVSWQDLMEASAVVSTKETGIKITPEEYENNIKKATFGEAIWATEGLENFFAGLISVGELVIARKIGRARK
ncbi:MAG: CBS domain-containing protein [Methanobacteriaceae archaeon]|nr:CBS domain-containing protein [Methanobacteriaceae archaeon]